MNLSFEQRRRAVRMVAIQWAIYRYLKGELAFHELQWRIEEHWQCRLPVEMWGSKSQ